MKILVSVLGKQPNEYRVVDWHLESFAMVRARMPAQVLAQTKQVDYVLLLIPDSLGQGDTYDALQNSARQLLPEPLPGDKAQWQPIVLPARYSSSVVGDVRDFYRAAILLLARWFAEHLLDPNESVDFYLDTSTGLNIFQLFTYRAVRDLAGALAFLREVTLQIYNADPVGPNTQQAGIFLTEEYRPLHASLTRVQVRKPPLLADLYTDGLHPDQNTSYQTLGNTVTTYWAGKDVVAFLNSVYYGIPLGIIRWFVEQPIQVFQSLEQIYQYIMSKARKDPRTNVFIRPINLGPDIVPYSIGALLSHQVQQRWDFFTRDLKRNGATYAQLNAIMEQMYRHHPVILNRFKAERSIMPEHLRCPQFPALLADCGSFPRCKGSVNRRNFFAHAGFERCAVEVISIEGDIYLRFASNTLSSVYRFLNVGER